MLMNNINSKKENFIKKYPWIKNRILCKEIQAADQKRRKESLGSRGCWYLFFIYFFHYFVICEIRKGRQGTLWVSLFFLIYAYFLIIIYTFNHLLLYTLSESRSVVSESLRSHGLYSPWNSPGQNTGVGNLSFSRGSSQPRDKTQVSHIAGVFFTSWD